MTCLKSVRLYWPSELIIINNHVPIRAVTRFIGKKMGQTVKATPVLSKGTFCCGDFL